MNYPYPYPWFYPQQKQEDSSNQIRHLFEQQLQFMQQRYENELTELRRQRALLEKKLDQIQLESQLSAKKNDFEKVEQMMQKLLEKTEQKLSAFDQKINALAEQINTQKAEHADSEKQQLLLRIEQLEKQNLAQAVQTPQPVQPVVQAPAVVPQVIQPQVVQSQPAFLATQQSISKQQQIAQLNAEINSIKKLIAQKAAK
uniref:Isoform HMW2-s of Cytadherence high molecular weight protein 2 n=2 Tax=Mycoplasmoides pneumoniae TaxID=2104 RepID=P75471-2